MNFVPFKLQTKRKEKKEVINLNKMEEERVDKLNQRHLEEMTFVQRGAVWDSYGEGRVLLFVYLGVDGFGDAISGSAVGPVATYRPGTSDWSSCLNQFLRWIGERINAQNQGRTPAGPAWTEKASWTLPMSLTRVLFCPSVATLLTCFLPPSRFFSLCKIPC